MPDGPLFAVFRWLDGRGRASAMLQPGAPTPPVGSVLLWEDARLQVLKVMWPAQGAWGSMLLLARMPGDVGA